jgi:histone deacetylase complex subunit SAP18
MEHQEEVNYERDEEMTTINDTDNSANNSAGVNEKFVKTAAVVAIDRKKTCPFMIKMYCRINGHHRMDEFNPPRFPVDDEMIVYTWKDATLKELSLLVREVLGSADLPGGIKGTDANLKFSFNLLYPDVRRAGVFTMKPLGWAFEGGETEAQARQLVDSSERTLESLRFMPGDFIDVAIFTNPAMIPNKPTIQQQPPPQQRRIFYQNNSRRF